MEDIYGDDKSLEDLLSGAAFGIEYYQRQYRWERKQVQELIDDLCSQFLQTWDPKRPEPEKQSKYFLGSIVVSKKNGTRFIVDGQQRITTLTLLLIYLNHLQSESDEANKVGRVKPLIFDEEPSGHKFKLDVPERNDCMKALLEGLPYNHDAKLDSVKNLMERYDDIRELFPEDEIEGKVLRSFIWWLIRNVKLIEITTQNDVDAYTIFETMNDRGLSLTPTEMLRGYLLANINDTDKREEANSLIKEYLKKFAVHGKETEADFFKAWLRSQYAEKIRERKKDAKPEDFDLIGTEYHRWVKDHAETIGLKSGQHFYRFITENFAFFADIYLRLLDASKQRANGLESVRYNSDAGFTLQYHLILAAISPDDDPATVTEKIRVTADFLDIWLNFRLWSQKSISYSTVQYTIYTLMRDIRRGTLTDIRTTLHDRLTKDLAEGFGFMIATHLYQFTSKSIHRQLARFTDWLEQNSGVPGKYEDYIIRSGKNAYEIEHIWANHHERFADEFAQQNDFEGYRNLIGGLLLLPKKVNASLNDMCYEDKLPHYLKENILAKSLHEDCYSSNPGFKETIETHNLPFRPHDEFRKDDLDERSNLYCQLASIIWSPDRLLDQ